MGDKHEERAREIVRICRVPGRSRMPNETALEMHIAQALRQSASEAAEKATAAERARCAEVARNHRCIHKIGQRNSPEYGPMPIYQEDSGPLIDMVRVAIATAIAKEPG